MKFINTHTQFKNGKFTITQLYNTKNTHYELSLILNPNDVTTLNAFFINMGLPNLLDMASANFVINNISKTSYYTALACFTNDDTKREQLLNTANEASVELTGSTDLTNILFNINQNNLKNGEIEALTEEQVNITVERCNEIYSYIEDFLDN